MLTEREGSVVFNIAKEEFQYGQHKVILETGEIARQASGAVVVNVEDTIVLATVVAAKSAKPAQDFFPADGGLHGKDLRGRKNSRRIF